MDLISFAGPPMLGAVFQWLVTTADRVVSHRNRQRKREKITVPESEVLQGRLFELYMDPGFTGMARIFEDLDFLQRTYDESGPFDPDDELLVAALSRLRRNLEALFGQHITFQGEQDRPASGTPVRVRVDAADVSDQSEVIGVDGSDEGVDLDVDLKAKNIFGGSRVIGYRRGDQ